MIPVARSPRWWRHPRWLWMDAGPPFCWPAALFGSAWAIARRGGAGLVTAMVVLDLSTTLAVGLLEARGTPVLAIGLQAAVALLQGARGRRWLTAGWARQGARPGRDPE